MSRELRILIAVCRSIKSVVFELPHFEIELNEYGKQSALSALELPLVDKEMFERIQG